MGDTDRVTPEFSSAAVGADGSWNLHLARAWTAVADPQGSHPPPPDPVAARGRNEDVTVGLNERIAYWGPFLPLLVYGLGWRRPDLGLERWHELGQPADDPVLAVVHRWWGRYVPHVLAWSAHSPYLAAVGHHLNDAFHDPGRDQLHPKWHDAGRTDTQWRSIFGSGDEMHLSAHLFSPVCASAGSPNRLLTGPDESARATLLCDGYDGWYRALSECGLTQTRHGSSWRVDVVVKPLGWLGTYRRSRQTGVWFSGQHRWHQLGWPRP